MPFGDFGNHDVIGPIFAGEFDHDDSVERLVALLPAEHLCPDGAWSHLWMTDATVGQILQELRDSQLIALLLALHRDDEVLCLPVRSDIQLINFDLADLIQLGAQMVLKGIRDTTAEKINQPVVANARQYGLFIV